MRRNRRDPAAAVLPLDAGGLIALLMEAGLVDDPDAVGIAVLGFPT